MDVENEKGDGERKVVDEDRVYLVKDGARKYYSCGGHAGMGTRRWQVSQRIQVWGWLVRGEVLVNNPKYKETENVKEDSREDLCNSCISRNREKLG